MGRGGGEGEVAVCQAVQSALQVEGYLQSARQVAGVLGAARTTEEVTAAAEGPVSIAGE